MSQVTMRIIFALFIVTDVLVAERSNLTLSTVLPDLHICSRYTWNVSQCIQHSIETMKPYLAAGVKVLNIPSFEPFHFPVFTFQAKEDFNGTWMLKDLSIHGITNYTISKTKVSPRENSNHHEIKFHARFPLIRLSFIYDVDAEIRVFSNNSFYLTLTEHNIKVEFTELTANITINGLSFRGFYDNEIYLQVTWVETQWNVGHTNIIDFNENYNGVADEIITRAVTTSLQVLAKTASNVIKTDISGYIQNVANSIFLNFPVKISFPI